MGLLTLFGKQDKPEMKRLPTGTFTIDSEGRVVTSTVPASLSPQHVREIGAHILAVFEGARKAQFPFQEMVANYGAFKITAREMRGGAIVFLSSRGTPGAPGGTP